MIVEDHPAGTISQHGRKSPGNTIPNPGFSVQHESEGRYQVKAHPLVTPAVPQNVVAHEPSFPRGSSSSSKHIPRDIYASS
jgi:hypothetical protein